MLVLITAGCEQSGTSTAPEDPARTTANRRVLSELNTIQVGVRPWPRTVRIQGDLVGDERAVVGAKVAG